MTSTAATTTTASVGCGDNERVGSSEVHSVVVHPSEVPAGRARRTACDRIIHQGCTRKCRPIHRQENEAQARRCLAITGSVNSDLQPIDFRRRIQRNTESAERCGVNSGSWSRHRVSCRGLSERAQRQQQDQQGEGLAHAVTDLSIRCHSLLVVPAESMLNGLSYVGNTLMSLWRSLARLGSLRLAARSQVLGSVLS